MTDEPNATDSLGDMAALQEDVDAILTDVDEALAALKAGNPVEAERILAEILEDYSEVERDVSG